MLGQFRTNIPPSLSIADGYQLRVRPKNSTKIRYKNIQIFKDALILKGLSFQIFWGPFWPVNENVRAGIGAFTGFYIF